MYCSSCGHALNPFDQACPGCGRRITPLPSAPVIGLRHIAPRVQQNLQQLAVFWLVYAGWTVIGWLFAVPFLTGFMGRWHGTPWGAHGFPFMPQLTWLVPYITGLVLLRAALYVVVGIGLLRRAPWARTLALVAAFLTIIKPLIGTLLAIYTLWVLLPYASAAEYDQIAMP